jgi:hypothetical protein
VKSITIFNVILYSLAAGVWLSGALLAYSQGKIGLCLANATLTVCFVFIAYRLGAPHVCSGKRR